MANIDVYEAFKELIRKLLEGDEEVAELAASDPEGLLAAYGVTDVDLAGVDFRQAVADCYHDYDLPGGNKQALESYVAGVGGPAHYEVREPPSYSGGPQPVDHAVQHLQYVTYAAYEHNENITTEIINRQLFVDNSDNRSFLVDNRTEVSVDVAGDLDGDVNVAATNATATGDGAVAGGDDLTAATGDGAVAGGRDVLANTGENSGLLADGDVRNAVIGEGNQTANLDIDTSGGAGGSADAFGGDASGTGGNASGCGGEDGFDQADGIGGDASGPGGNAGATGGSAGGGAGGDVGPINFNFGGGDQAATTVGRDVDNSAVAGIGDADNVADNRVDDGSALATGRGDASGSQSIVEDSFNETTIPPPAFDTAVVEPAEEAVLQPLPETEAPVLQPIEEAAGA
jgi:hypothetical protein